MWIGARGGASSFFPLGGAWSTGGGPVEEAQSVGGSERFHLVTDAKFPEEPCPDIFHCLGRDAQRAGRLPDRVTAGDRAEDVILPRRQLRQRGRRRRCPIQQRSGVAPTRCRGLATSCPLADWILLIIRNDHRPLRRTDGHAISGCVDRSNTCRPQSAVVIKG